MKKKISLIFVGLLFTVCGCSSNDSLTSKPSINTEQTELTSEPLINTEQTKETQTENSIPEEQEIYNVGDSVSLNDWAIKVTDMQIVDSITAKYGAFSPKEAGNKYLQVFVSVDNNGKQADSFLPAISIGNKVKTKLVYGDGYEFTSTNLLGYDNDLHDSTINPLSSRTGEIAFEIPETVANSTDELIIQFISGKDIVKIKVR